MRHDDAQTQLPASFTDSFALWARKFRRRKWRRQATGSFEQMQDEQQRLIAVGKFSDFYLAHDSIDPNRKPSKPRPS